eukprot:SAG22_NODE_3257_length_1825_cov_1.590962_2_plen_116_part_00
MSPGWRPGPHTQGGSTTSGKNCAGAQMAAQAMKTRFDGVRRLLAHTQGGAAGDWPASMSTGEWLQLVQAASHAKLDMCVKSWTEGFTISGNGCKGGLQQRLSLSQFMDLSALHLP